MKIGSTIKKIRKEKKLSQEDMFERTGISKTSISSIETGRYIPTEKNLFFIACALGVSVEYLYFRALENMNVKESLEIEFEVYYKKLKFILEQPY